MVAALVIATFVIFVAVDYYLHRRSPQPEAGRVAAEPPSDFHAAIPLNVVGGFKVPAHVSYHPGHAWALKESSQVVRIGLDDFAARLVGKIDQIDLPARGRWLRQGERGWTLGRGSHRFEMLSPIEGEVVDVNPEVLANPAVAHGDPYGVGWLLAVHAPAVEGNLKNLLRGRLAQRWMEESIATLHLRLDPASEGRLQDGGHAIGDVLSLVPEFQWEKVVAELLLT